MKQNIASQPPEKDRRRLSDFLLYYKMGPQLSLPPDTSETYRFSIPISDEDCADIFLNPIFRDWIINGADIIEENKTLPDQA